MKTHEKITDAIKKNPEITYRELMTLTGVKSTSVIHYHLRKRNVKTRGQLVRELGTMRAICRKYLPADIFFKKLTRAERLLINKLV